MTKILSSFLPSNKLFFALLPVLGTEQTLAYKFTSEDPLLVSARVEQIELKNTCEETLKQSLTWVWGIEDFKKAWMPWTLEDESAVRYCEEFPCDVKLNKPEVDQMKSKSLDGRQKKFEELVLTRWSAYEKTLKRPEYEFKGDPVDPWSYFGDKNLNIGKDILNQKPKVEYRRYEFAPGKLRPLRQVLDHRTYLDASKTRVLHLVRDAYTAHYFDSWGEWVSLECPDLKKQNVILTQVLFLELDLLKKKDLFSVFSYSKMRMTVEQFSKSYQDSQRKQWFR